MSADLIPFLAEAGAFILLIALLEWAHTRERRDLLNRLMARSLPEYVQQTESPVLPKSRNYTEKQIEKSRRKQAIAEEE